jgi:N-acyl-D-amino-acid deacylase
VASRYAAFEETRVLCQVLKDFDKAVFSPNIGSGLSLQQVGELASEIRAHVSWTPLLSNLIIHPVDFRVELAQTKALADRGLPVYAQISPKPIVVEFQFTSSLHFESMAAYHPATVVDTSGKKRLFADTGFRKVMREAVASRSPIFAAAIEKTEIGEGSDPSLVGRTLADVAAERLQSPIEVAFDLAIASDLQARFRLPVANHVDQDVHELLSSPYTHIALGDGGAHVDQLCDANTPTYFLRHWVREKKIFSWEEAIRMLTSRQADIYNLNRGRLGMGMPADIVVFDGQTISEGKLRRVHDLPANGSRLISDAIGIDAVIVNGVPIRRNGENAVDPNGPLPGIVLRRGKTL